MGNTLRSGRDNGSNTASNAQTPDQRRGQKRSLDKDSLGEEEVEELSPKRKKIVATSTYIYETLFQKGVDSDVTISSLG